MKCPYCDWLDSKVIDSRPTDEGTAVRRRRECSHCGKRFTTYEKLEITPVYVVKKDGRREIFDANKIMRGIIKACEKRPVAMKDIETIVSSIERQINLSQEREVASEQIGEMIMEALSKLDAVAYVRFASVYRQFRDVHTFMAELKKMMSEKES